MNTIFLILFVSGALFGVGYLARLAWQKYESINWGENWWEKVKFIASRLGLLAVIGSAVLYHFLTEPLYEPAMRMINKIFLPIYKFIVGMFVDITYASPWHGALVAIAVFLAFIYFVYKTIVRFGKIESGGGKFLLKFFLTLVFSAWALKIFNENVDFITHLLITAYITFGLAFITVVRNWSDKYQNSLALPVAYIGNIVMFWTLIWTVSGLNIFNNITGSLMMPIPFIMFNVGIIFILDRVLELRKKFNQKFSYFLNYAAALTTSILFIAVTVLMVTGHLNRYKLENAHLNNKAFATLTDLDRRLAFSEKIEGKDFVEWKEELKPAAEENDREKLVKIIKNNQHYKKEVEGVEENLKAELGDNYKGYDVPVFGALSSFGSDASGFVGKAWHKVFGGDGESGPGGKAKTLTPEQLLQQSLEKYTAMWGTPKKVVLDKDKWEDAFKVRPGEIVHYLSLDNFFVKGKTSEKLWEPQLSRDGQIQFINFRGICPMSFKKYDKNLTVYAWKRRA